MVCCTFLRGSMMSDKRSWKFVSIHTLEKTGLWLGHRRTSYSCLKSHVSPNLSKFLSLFTIIFFMLNAFRTEIPQRRRLYNFCEFMMLLGFNLVEKARVFIVRTLRRRWLILVSLFQNYLFKRLNFMRRIFI